MSSQILCASSFDNIYQHFRAKTDQQNRTGVQALGSKEPHSHNFNHQAKEKEILMNRNYVSE